MRNKTITAQSPGRINIIGEHTDYNDGFVLPAAIDKKSVFKLALNGTDCQVAITAGNVQESFSFDLKSFHPISSGWQNYVMGVVYELQKLGAKITGFDGEFEGDVPIGSGMSSSAALECSLVYGLNELFELGFSKWQLIKACQMAEHYFVGIKCGIMDQFASMMGKKNQVMLLDCRSLEFQYYPLDLGDYELLLLNTNVSHSLAESQYNQRRAACGEGVEMIQKIHPEVQNLRDVSLDMLLSLVGEMPEHIFRRCHHIVSENQRVLEATKSLQKKNFQQLGQLIYQSHFSLQTDFEVSCPELDFLVQQTLDKDYILGSRMMGGGFGGCTINVIDKKFKDQYIEDISLVYHQHFGLHLAAYSVSVEDGAKVIY
jgi:galactokinase